MADRDYSQMPVHFDTEATAIARCVRVHGCSLAAGHVCGRRAGRDLGDDSADGRSASAGSGASAW